MNLTSVYTVMSPPDMKIISEPGLPQDILLTICFGNAVRSCLFTKGESPRNIAQRLRVLANDLEELHE